MYRFIRGRVCTSEDLTREHIWRGVARRLAEWHARLPVDLKTGPNKPNVKENPNRRKRPSFLPVKPSQLTEDIKVLAAEQAPPTLWTVLHKWICALPTQTELEKHRKIELGRELQRTIGEIGHRPGLGRDGVGVAPCPAAVGLKN